MIVCFFWRVPEAVGGEIAGCHARWNACRLSRAGHKRLGAYSRTMIQLESIGRLC
jgi:hypothetical protein